MGNRYITATKTDEERYLEYIQNAQKYNASQISEEEALSTSLAIQIDTDDTERMYAGNVDTEEGQQALNEAMMQEAYENYAERQEYHLVRGAMIRCTCGTHCRKLNLMVSHNMYEKEKTNALMNEYDSIPQIASMPDMKYNIPSFGVCNSGNNKSESVIFKKDFPRDAHGKKISDTRMEGNVKGPRCSPEILTTWLCPHEGSIVDGGAAISLNSYLVCAYGGLVEVLDSGQSSDQ